MTTKIYSTNDAHVSSRALASRTRKAVNLARTEVSKRILSSMSFSPRVLRKLQRRCLGTGDQNCTLPRKRLCTNRRSNISASHRYFVGLRRGTSRKELEDLEGVEIIRFLRAVGPRDFPEAEIRIDSREFPSLQRSNIFVYISPAEETLATS
jgi:hypothetical protein